jgi:hypothetical protein
MICAWISIATAIVECLADGLIAFRPVSFLGLGKFSSASGNSHHRRAAANGAKSD